VYAVTDLMVGAEPAARLASDDYYDGV
jgi:hypothetical protein